jgi:hypothetical protein
MKVLLVAFAKHRRSCVVQRDTFIVGAIEFMAGLTSHAQNVIATRDSEVFILDLRNAVRIIYNNRQTQTIDVLYNIVLQILWARNVSPSGSQVSRLENFASSGDWVYL